jgi:hypothetical protein
MLCVMNTIIINMTILLAISYLFSYMTDYYEKGLYLVNFIYSNRLFSFYDFYNGLL